MEVTKSYVVQGGSNSWVLRESCGMTIQMKATEQYFPVVVFIMLYMYKVVMTFGSVKAFRYSFSEAIPIFFNRFKSDFILVQSL